MAFEQLCLSLSLSLSTGGIWLSVTPLCVTQDPNVLPESAIGGAELQGEGADRGSKQQSERSHFCTFSLVTDRIGNMKITNKTHRAEEKQENQLKRSKFCLSIILTLIQ